VKTADAASGKFTARIRVDGEPSSSPPVLGAPSWAIKRGYQTTPTSSRTTRVKILLLNCMNMCTPSIAASNSESFRSCKHISFRSATSSKVHRKLYEFIV